MSNWLYYNGSLVIGGGILFLPVFIIVMARIDGRLMRKEMSAIAEAKRSRENLENILRNYFTQQDTEWWEYHKRLVEER